MKTSLAAAALLAIGLPLVAADAPHVQLDKLDTIVIDLAARKVVNAGQEKSLRTKLAHTAEAMESGDRRSAAQRLHTFAAEVRALAKEKDLTPVADLAEAIQAQIGAIDTTPVFIDRSRLQLCATQQCKDRGRLFVDVRSTSVKPDGSPGQPFRTIGEAMDKGRFLALCNLEVVIAPGVYPENVLVDRELTLRASAAGVILEGSVLNHAGHGLVVDGLTLANSPSPGAIVVDFSCSTTTISNVLIDGATDYGVRQSGGSVEIFRTEVRGTRSRSDESTSGAGIRLTSGALVAMRQVTIEGNSAGGLLIEGVRTKVYASALDVRANHVNPSYPERAVTGFFPGIAGIEVRNGLLLLEWFHLEENQMHGLVAADGARVAARYGAANTSRILSLERGGFGGFGFYAFDRAALAGEPVPAGERAIIDLNFVSAYRNEWVGVAFHETFGTAHRMTVEHNTIGFVAGFHLSVDPELPSHGLIANCVDRTDVRHNVRDIGLDLSLPPPIPCSPHCPPLPPCREIAFVCDWCT